MDFAVLFLMVIDQGSEYDLGLGILVSFEVTCADGIQRCDVFLRILEHFLDLLCRGLLPRRSSTAITIANVAAINILNLSGTDIGTLWRSPEYRLASCRRSRCYFSGDPTGGLCTIFRWFVPPQGWTDEHQASSWLLCLRLFATAIKTFGAIIRRWKFFFVIEWAREGGDHYALFVAVIIGGLPLFHCNA